MTRPMILATGLVFASLFTSPLPLGAQQQGNTWWDTETALDEAGHLLLTNKPWWERATALKVGEQFIIRSEQPGDALMLIRREHITRRGGHQADAIVWIIDDDGDMRPDAIDGDKKNDCYVVDYEGNGRADRMVDYIDADGDGKPEEMEIRYFHEGQLRVAWFGVDLDRRGRTFPLAGYEYAGSETIFRSYVSGNAFAYANKYDPQQRRWWPISECPFAFYDASGKGQPEAAVRLSAVPLDFDIQREPDFGNSGFSYVQPFSPRLRNIGVVNVRYSVDVDGQRSAERPLHYDLGLNMIGHVPYEFPGMARENVRRRTPSTTYCIPHAAARALAEIYPAEQTGFSWREFTDTAMSQGEPQHPAENRRWEGVFWTWNRRIMHDTGGPTQAWNVRREFCPAASTRRELYYCRADHRVHLKGATEGWVLAGHLHGNDTWGEIRMFDTNGDGYFDRWETYRAGEPTAARVSTSLDPGVRNLPGDWHALQQLYTQELLPAAIQANQELTAAMSPLADFTPPEYLTKALQAATCDMEKCYVLDLLRETQYLALRVKLAQRSQELLAATPPRDLSRQTAEQRAASETAWAYARILSKLDVAYGDGRYSDGVECLRELTMLVPR